MQFSNTPLLFRFLSYRWSMSSIHQDQINHYLDRYAASLSSFDAETAASLWATPGLIVDNRFSGVLESRDQMVQGLEQSYPLYQKLGLASVGYEVPMWRRGDVHT